MNLKIKYVLLLLILGISHSLQAQFETVDSSFRAKLIPSFEFFDSAYFKKIELTERDTLVDGTVIIMSDWGNYKSYREIPPDSHWSLFKYYYANGYIREKGIWNIDNRDLKIGTWYYFDEQGNLTDSINYDEHFKFTFEQVLDFAKKEKAEDIEKYKTLMLEDSSYEYQYEKAKNPKFGRLYNSKEDKSIWSIRWDDTPYNRDYLVKLDGNTGEVISREYEDKGPARY